MSTTITALNNLRIGRIIKLERILRAMTLDALGTEIGCHNSTLTQYENGTRPVPRDKMQELSDFFAAHPVEKVRGFEPRLIDRDAA